MDRNMRAIYNILKVLEGAMDNEGGANPDALTARALKVSEPRLDNLWAMLAKEGYVTGVMVQYMDNERLVIVDNPRITLQGVEYLAENTAMRRIQREMKGIKDALPGL